jgi:hypothetical protein
MRFQTPIMTTAHHLRHNRRNHTSPMIRVMNHSHSPRHYQRNHIAVALVSMIPLCHGREHAVDVQSMSGTWHEKSTQHHDFHETVMNSSDLPCGRQGSHTAASDMVTVSVIASNKSYIASDKVIATRQWAGVFLPELRICS